MGWCSGTIVFDAVCDALFVEDADGCSKEYAIKALIEALQDSDWDCENESEYFDNPLVKKCFIELGNNYWEEE